MQHGTRIIFEFSEQADKDAWRSINDVVMGGVSSSELRVTAEGVAIFEGIVSLERGGGFASVSSPFAGMDLGNFEGIEVRVRGDGKDYRLRVRTNDGDEGVAYQASFQTERGIWRTEELPFEAFEARYHGRSVPDAQPLDAGKIVSFGFLIADRQAGPFHLEIDWIRAYAEKGY